jgi:hypothetical protein
MSASNGLPPLVIIKPKSESEQHNNRKWNSCIYNYTARANRATSCITMISFHSHLLIPDGKELCCSHVGVNSATAAQQSNQPTPTKQANRETMIETNSVTQPTVDIYLLFLFCFCVCVCFICRIFLRPLSASLSLSQSPSPSVPSPSSASRPLSPSLTVPLVVPPPFQNDISGNSNIGPRAGI